MKVIWSRDIIVKRLHDKQTSWLVSCLTLQPNKFVDNFSVPHILQNLYQIVKKNTQNDLKIKCKYKSWNLIFWRSSGDEASDVANRNLI